MGKKEKQEIESLKSRNGDLEKKMAKDRNEAEKRLKEEKDNARAVLADWQATAEEEKAKAVEAAKLEGALAEKEAAGVHASFLEAKVAELEGALAESRDAAAAAEQHAAEAQAALAATSAVDAGAPGVDEAQAAAKLQACERRRSVVADRRKQQRDAEEAETLRVMANHCRERNDLQAALAYMERSCSAYTSSLQSGESAAAAPSRAPTALEAARATPLATLAAPAHATQPAPLGPDDALVPDAVPARLKRAPPRSLLNADREDRDPRPPRPRSPGSVPAVVSSRPHCVRHRVETPPRPLPLDDDLIV